jgi:hypothetical protein
MPFESGLPIVHVSSATLLLADLVASDYQGGRVGGEGRSGGTGFGQCGLGLSGPQGDGPGMGNGGPGIGSSGLGDGGPGRGRGPGFG